VTDGVADQPANASQPTADSSPDTDVAIAPIAAADSPKVPAPSRLLLPLSGWWWLLLLLGGTFCLAFYDLDGGAGFEPIDCWVAQTAREMDARDQWLIPVFSGETRLQKSPGPYWGVMLVGDWLDRPIDEVTARIPNGFAALLLVATVFWLTRAVAGNRAAIFAGFATASSTLVLQWSHRAASDFGLTACCALSLAAFWVAYAKRSGGVSRMTLVWLAYLAAGLGMLWKMPMPIAIIGVPAYLYCWKHWLQRRPPGRWWLAMVVAGLATGGLIYLLAAGTLGVGLEVPTESAAKLGVVAALAAFGVVIVVRLLVTAPCDRRELVTHLIGVLLFLAPWLPWAYQVVQVEETALAKWKVEYVDRFTGDLPNVEDQDGVEFLFMYLAVPLIYCLPYTLSLPGAIARGVKPPRGVSRDGTWAMLLWFVGLLLFFTISTGKEWRYFLPALPPLFVLLGIELAWLFDPRRAGHPRVEQIGGAIIAVGVPVGFGVAIWTLTTQWYPLVGAPSGFDLSDVLLPAVVLGLIFSAGAMASVLLFLRGARQVAFGALVLTMWSAWLWLWPNLMPVMVSQVAFKDIALQMRQRLTPEMRADLYQLGAQDPRVMWYGDIKFPRLINQLDLLALQDGQREHRREVMVYAREILARLRSPERTLLVGTIRDYVDFRSVSAVARRKEINVPASYRWLVTQRGRLDRYTVVFGNQPPPWPEPALPARVQERLAEQSLELIPDDLDAFVESLRASIESTPETEPR
jgi:4-amino-4-deoxy-L-arabinose transferase-like glycosyltransferase